jgi:hypothetical protein
MPQEVMGAGVPSAEHQLAGAAKSWLTGLQECVRSLDYAKARTLFDEGVVSFGTQVNTVEVGLGDVEREQWREVWPRVRNFTYRLGEARFFGEANCLCVLVPWDSVGVHADGATHDRSGRTTFVLSERGCKLTCVHFHSSLISRP